MLTSEAVWLLAHRADYLNTVPEELQEFVKTNVRNIASVCNFYDHTVRNNGSLSWATCYDSEAARQARIIENLPQHAIAVIATENLPAGAAVTANNTFLASTFLLPLTNVKEHKIEDKTYLSQLDPEFIKYLGDILDLSDLLGKGLTVKAHLSAFDFKSGSNIDITSSVMKKHGCWVDNVGSIAILDDELIEKFKEKFSNVNQVKALKTASLYKGSAPYFGPDYQSIANLASGGRFFLYSTNIEILDKEIKTVPFIGLAVFGGEKLIKYKNSLSILSRLQGFSDALSAQAILFPEKYKEIVKLNSPPVAEYWPGLTKILGEKNTNNSKYNLLDTSTIKRDDDGKFKAFFINSVLSRTPEASRYLAMKAKHEAIEKQNKELKAKLVKLEKDIKLLRSQVLEDTETIRDLQGKITKSINQVHKDTETLIEATPQAERVTNAALELMTQLQPLEADYQSAITKYWEQEISLETLRNWEEEGFLIKEIALYDGYDNRALDTVEKIRARMSQGDTSKVFISKMTIYTTKPTVIYKDAHVVGREKAIQYAGGPYIITLGYTGSTATMAIRLLDDRSIRATWNDGYYRYFCIHPHTPKFYYDEPTFKTSPQSYWAESTKKSPTPCMGEFEPILAKGMKGLALAEIIYGLRGWLQTATSTDGYGTNVIKFPLASEIIISRYISPKPPEAKKLEEVQPVYSKQSTYVKKDGDKFLATIFLTEDTKVIAYEAEGTISDEELVLEKKKENILLFLNTAQRDIAMLSTKEELEKLKYTLFAEQKAVKEVTFKFPGIMYALSTLRELSTLSEEESVTETIPPPESREPYRPASARRITEQVINELQEIIEAPPQNPV